MQTGVGGTARGASGGSAFRDFTRFSKVPQFNNYLAIKSRLVMLNTTNQCLATGGGHVKAGLSRAIGIVNFSNKGNKQTIQALDI